MLIEKFTFDEEDVDIALAYVLESIEEIVPVPQKMSKTGVGKVRDQNDLHVLVAAQAAKAIIVTGDKDILEIPIKRVKVMCCLDVLKLLQESSEEVKTSNLKS